jgi:hypothetical protein
MRLLSDARSTTAHAAHAAQFRRACTTVATHSLMDPLGRVTIDPNMWIRFSHGRSSLTTGLFGSLTGRSTDGVALVFARSMPAQSTSTCVPTKACIMVASWRIATRVTHHPTFVRSECESDNASAFSRTHDATEVNARTHARLIFARLIRSPCM